uniref:2'-5' oligoadenylate synthase n=1 Tax=Gopherus evgoodei TaxID=1825980 RepID=A0A8C4Y8G9_9SAUR
MVASLSLQVFRQDWVCLTGLRSSARHDGLDAGVPGWRSAAVFCGSAGGVGEAGPAGDVGLTPLSRQGGSLGKGTSLKDSSDADLVVFLSCFKGYGDQETNRAGIIKEIERMLEKCQQEKHFEVFIEQSRWPNPRVLSFKMSSETLDESIEFDVLPAYNALSSGAKPMSQVYEELIQSCSRGGEFSTCFTELQRDFVVDRRTKVKSLIRLVKYWYKQVQQPGQSLPPQYALELLSVYAWEQGSRDRAFNMAEGFRTVLELIQQYKHLCVYWTINYNFADEVLAGFLHHQLQKARPIILDPADPTGIVGEGSRWDLLAQEAESSLVVSSPPPVMGLYQTLAEELDTFISNDLQPNRVFKTQISTAIHTIFLFLTQNCFRNSGSAMRAGSSGKGMALKDVSDVDLVVFVSSITDFRALKAERKKIIAEIQTRLEECRASLGKDLVLSIKKTKWENPRVLTFTLTSSTTDEHIDFDVLPAFDALGQLYRGYKPDPQVYLRLTESDPEGSEFSPCFTELSPCPPASLPPQYALELLSVYAWEQGSRDPAFNMAEGFRMVLELIRQHAQLCVYWAINYGFENETLRRYLKSQLCKPRPIILDPADPTGIVGQGSRWDLVAQEAKHCCGQQCCWKRNGSAIQPWNVPVRAGFPAMAHINRMFATGGHAAEQESYCTLL